jgi:hypothetical protein
VQPFLESKALVLPAGIKSVYPFALSDDCPFKIHDVLKDGTTGV